MKGIPDITYIASLIADKRRAIMLDALMSKEKLNATELAKKANITPQTASSHLTKLVAGGLINVESNGRSKFYNIARPEVAEALEALTLIGTQTTVKSLSYYDEVNQHQKARSCYDHLAGNLGVQITKKLVEKEYLIDGAEKDYVVSEKGEVFFRNFGIDLALLKKKKRHLARKCLDWSEQQYHLAGALGAAMQEKFLHQKWIYKKPDSRVILITETGSRNFSALFDI